jgi:peptidoglycan hydrolase CwlO-like protein
MNEAVLPIIASLVTLLVTKLFDLFIASKKDKISSLTASLTAVDEMSSAATETIKYLREEIVRLRQELAIRDKYIDALEKELKNETN